MTSEPTAFSYTHLYDVVRDHITTDPLALAEMVVQDADPRDVRQFAVYHVEARIEACRRVLARQAEEAATVVVPPPPIMPPIQSPFKEPVRSAKERREAREWRFTTARESFDHRCIHSNQQEAFRKWMGDEFHDWLDKCKQKAFEAKDNPIEGQYEAQLVACTWNPSEIPMPQRPSAASVFNWKIQQMLDDMAATIRLEVTEELLSTRFALGDGSTVTWGHATVTDHERRIELLTKNAVGTMETAGRHAAAIRMIQESGVTCLDEVAQPVAA